MAEFVPLRKGQTLKLADGRTVTVTDKLGEGGQGIVYRVRYDTGEERALKWFFIGYLKDPSKFYRHLESNIHVGSPSEAFLWPEQLTEYVSGETFGYTMKIFPKGYESFSRYLLAKTRFKNVAAMVDAALNIVAAFKALHNKGYNYQDLNDGNFSIDPTSGKVLICDNDNVMGHGEYSGVLGKARYMAPEVVRGDKQPDKSTDRFSLAVILFMLLIGNHPLEGIKTNYPALTNKYEKRIYGTEPLFIFDENDPSNAPHKLLHQNALRLWGFFPSFIQAAFRQSFSQESLLEGKERLLEQAWFNILMRLKSSLVRCPHCGEEMFLESDRATTCQSCKRTVKAVGHLLFDKRAGQDVTVPIFKDAALYEYHMNPLSEDFETRSAVILEKPGKFGLKNASNYNWKIKTPSEKILAKQPGEVLVLGADAKIDFYNKNIAQVIVNN
ncbi:MAG: hypothetical protein IJP42_09870 [Selenomonadaceae bacterium]|nr:hypothetical protein [Selenomonadaceae bacterium]